ncbi:hypothetical protein COCCU_07120 [Corynebacterium occultum]|uniref:PhnB-like domain-containing protein n=1 Tax=Corynebacterium occultum TaxID=2675219 RepID=A0A6B8WLT4_9CORY|nr:VOC family protein [Corynebacterium occultum]QGU07358.1 hypothetical protein COCCU_07120 [Corynebacterium occultum]
MQADLTPYRHFPGTAQAAMEFYRDLFDGDLQLTPFSSVHPPEEVGEMSEEVMHAALTVDGRTLLFASDIPPGMEPIKGEDTPLSLTGGGDIEAELRGYWEKLAEGGEVSMPLQEVPWGGFYGSLKDRFGTHWLINIGG